MAKIVRMKSGRVFNTLGAAKKHFSDLREATAIGAHLTEPDRSDAIDVCERYCRATNWQGVTPANVTAAWENSKRPAGGYAQTKALVVVAASGEQTVFSMEKALADIGE